MEEVAITILKKYFEELSEEYKEASRDFFNKKAVWNRIYRSSEDISYHDTNYIEYHELQKARLLRSKIGSKKAKVKALLKELEIEEM